MSTRPMECGSCGKDHPSSARCGKTYKGSALKKQKPEKPVPDLSSRTCGCTAGILITADDGEIQRCDDCALFETDEDAINAVEHLLKLLHREYETSTDATVADSFDNLVGYAEHAHGVVGAAKLPPGKLAKQAEKVRSQKRKGARK